MEHKAHSRKQQGGDLTLDLFPEPLVLSTVQAACLCALGPPAGP